MKKLRNILMIALAALLLTGCAKLNYDVTIKNDKSMNISIIYAVPFEGDAKEINENDLSDYKEEGWKIQPYKDEKYQGFTISKKIDNIDEYCKNYDVEVDLTKIEDYIEDKQLFYKENDIYYADWELLDMVMDDIQVDGMDVEKPDVKLVVHLPSNALEDNSESKNKKELVWDFTKQEEAKFSFKLKDTISTVISVMATLFALGIAALLYFSNASKRPKKKTAVIAKVEEKPKEPVITEVASEVVEPEAPAEEITEAAAPKEKEEFILEYDVSDDDDEVIDL